MHISRLDIRNFRNFANATFLFEKGVNTFIGENGSGKTNAFYDASDPQHLSAVGKSYIAGIMEHAREMALVTNQWVNSYKRLVPGYEAPVYVAWAQRNRSTMVRVPMYKPGKELATRIEFRSPDPACNPYLAFAAMLAAGMNVARLNFSHGVFESHKKVIDNLRAASRSTGKGVAIMADRSGSEQKKGDCNEFHHVTKRGRCGRPR